MKICLEWGVPRICTIEPILFLVYIKDLEEGVTGKILKFADDIKLFRKTKENGDKQTYKMTIQGSNFVNKSTCPMDKRIYKTTCP